MSYKSTKIIELGSCAFRQWRADSHCKFIHGYRLIAKFWFSCSTLDDKNWVVDFGGLKDLKSILEKQFDHTFCVAGDDPHLELFQQLHNARVCDLRIMEGGVGIEKTAEWCFKIADTHIRDITNNRCWVEQVEVWEHDKNSAIYGKNDIKECPQPEVVLTHTAVAAPAPEIQAAVNTPRPAPVGNRTSTGLGNPFGGTSWGS